MKKIAAPTAVDAEYWRAYWSAYHQNKIKEMNDLLAEYYRRQDVISMLATDAEIKNREKRSRIAARQREYYKKYSKRPEIRAKLVEYNKQRVALERSRTKLLKEMPVEELIRMITEE